CCLGKRKTHLAPPVHDLLGFPFTKMQLLHAERRVPLTLLFTTTHHHRKRTSTMKMLPSRGILLTLWTFLSPGDHLSGSDLFPHKFFCH
ncbi:unnamed protein product, partial [Amoebophrya sp. A120]